MIEADRLISADIQQPEEEIIDRAIRPKLLAEYVGQPQVVNRWKSLFRRLNYVMMP